MTWHDWIDRRDLPKMENWWEGTKGEIWMILRQREREIRFELEQPWNGMGSKGREGGGFGRKNGRDLRRCGGIGELGGIEQNSYRKGGRGKMKDEKDIHTGRIVVWCQKLGQPQAPKLQSGSLTEAPLSVSVCVCVCVQKSVWNKNKQGQIWLSCSWQWFCAGLEILWNSSILKLSINLFSSSPQFCQFVSVAKNLNVTPIFKHCICLLTIKSLSLSIFSVQFLWDGEIT